MLFPHESKNSLLIYLLSNSKHLFNLHKSRFFYTNLFGYVVCRFVRWEFISIRNRHMSDGNLYPFGIDICRFGMDMCQIHKGKFVLIIQFDNWCVVFAEGFNRTTCGFCMRTICRTIWWTTFTFCQYYTIRTYVYRTFQSISLNEPFCEDN